LTRAGTLLAKLDGAAPAKRSSLLQQIVGSLSAPPKPKRRSWFFAAAPAAMPDAKRIEQVLQAALKDSKRLVLDQELPDSPSEANGEINCVLPPGAVDPICESR
jgi:hypothetical protein